MNTIKVIVSKNKFNSFSFAKLDILGSIQTMSFDDYKRLVACILNPTFSNYMGEEYENDMDYSSMLKNLEQKNRVIMDYEKEYKKRLDDARYWHDVSEGDIPAVLEEIFPELRESEDDRIRKGIIRNLEYLADRAEGFVKDELKERIAWLEKQGHTDNIIEKAKTEKQRVIITETDGNANIDWDTRSLQDVKLLLEYGLDYIKKLDEKNCLSNTKHSMGDLKIISSLKNIIHTYWNNLPDSALEENEVAESCYRWLEKQGQKPADNFKPKFKAGDWVMLDRPVLITKVEDMPFNTHQYWTSDGTWFGDATKSKLWTIQDAKDGDVLVHNGFTFIFKGIEDGIVKGLCSELSDSILNFGEPEHDKDYYPATKEQRYFLFQKMKEAGYEWDVEKKELKKIENRPMLSDFFNAEYERGKADALKSVEWSEEDEKNLVQCIEAIDVYYEWDSMIDWLKSLRSRSRWKPSEEQMRALHDMNLTGNISYAGQGQVLIELYNDLKKL